MPAPERRLSSSRSASSSKETKDSISEPVEALRYELRSLAQGQASLSAGQARLHEAMAKLLEASNIPHSLKMTELLRRPDDELENGFSKQVAPKDEASFNDTKGGRVSFIDGQKGQEIRKVQTLKKIFQVAEATEKEQAEENLKQTNFCGPVLSRFSNLSKAELETGVDLFVGVFICLNAVLIGIHMDNPEPRGMWMAIDVLFSCIFIAELSFKIWLHGLKGQFCGDQAFANCFDAFLILLDLTQLMLELIFPDIAKQFEGAPSASLFRIVRLARLGRLVRAMKAEVFRSLVEMIHGIAAGMTTLGWSCVLFFFFVYVSALVLRESLGRTEAEFVYEMFDSVPRAIYTTFRCSFGDCSAGDGTPIFEHVIPTYGVFYVLVYCCMTFVTTIVIFNVISAMFVESTMAAAVSLSDERKRARMQNEKLLFSNISFFIKRILHFSPDHEVPESLSESLDEIMHAEVPLSVIDATIKDPAVKEALNALDINPQDHGRLSDIFDPDNGGTVELADVATGLRRLRGDPRRSDIVCVDLMIRSLQPVLAEILDGVQQLCSSSSRL